MQVPADRVSKADGVLSLKKVGMGVIIGFTVKGLITTALLVITLFEFIPW